MIVTTLAPARSTPRIQVDISAISAVRNVTSRVAGSSIAGGESAGRAGERPGRAVADQLARPVGMEALGREPGDRALDHHRLDSRQERLRLLHGGVIAGDQDDRDAMMQATSAFRALSPTAVPFSRASDTASGL